jgi:uncharacterized membrane protein (UPF0136 family)
MGWNEQVSLVSGVASGALHVYAHMYFADWTVAQGFESPVTWIMVVSAFVGTWLLLTEKDGYYGN